jgi:hypothetical protein
MTDEDGERHSKTLKIDPEHLSARPGVKEVVNVCSDDGHKHECDLEQRVSIHALEVLLANAHLARELRLIKHTAVG